MTADPPLSAPRWRIIAAFATVYLVWGTTYFAIGEIVHTIPPLLMTASRFLVAGTLLFTWRRFKAPAPPTWAHWRAAALISALLLLGGYGTTAWAQQRVPSGLTALLVSVTPLLMVMIDWLRPGGTRPHGAVFAGLALGGCGIVLLLGPARLEAARETSLGWALLCLCASLSWSTGSILSRQVKQAPDVFLAAGMQMLVGTVWLALAALIAGEPAHFSWAVVDAHAIVAWLYLTFAGSLAAFSAYLYLLKMSTPARASTYAYVNPAIAVFVGWALGHEVVNSRILFAASLLLGGVALITVWRDKK